MPSPEAIERATGRTWSFWATKIDSYGAADHRERARRLALDHPEISGWWVQSLVVEYEQSKGLRELGQTAQGYQVSCSKTFDMRPNAMWDQLTGPGFLAEAQWTAGVTWTTDGAEVEVRRVDPPRVLRWFWHDAQGKSTVEATIQDREDRCTIVIRHHGLPNAQAREHYRKHWKAALVRLAQDHGRRA